MTRTEYLRNLGLDLSSRTDHRTPADSWNLSCRRTDVYDGVKLVADYYQATAASAPTKLLNIEVSKV